MATKVQLPQGFIVMTQGDVVVGRLTMRQAPNMEGEMKPRGLLEASKAAGGGLSWLPSHADLTRKLALVPDGAVVRVTALGSSKKKTRFGTKDTFLYDVEIMDRAEVLALVESGDAALSHKRLLAAPKEGGGDHGAGGDGDAPF